MEKNKKVKVRNGLAALQKHIATNYGITKENYIFDVIPEVIFTSKHGICKTRTVICNFVVDQELNGVKPGTLWATKAACSPDDSFYGPLGEKIALERFYRDIIKNGVKLGKVSLAQVKEAREKMENASIKISSTMEEK